MSWSVDLNWLNLDPWLYQSFINFSHRPVDDYYLQQFRGLWINLVIKILLKINLLDDLLTSPAPIRLPLIPQTWLHSPDLEPLQHPAPAPELGAATSSGDKLYARAYRVTWHKTSRDITRDRPHVIRFTRDSSWDSCAAWHVFWSETALD